ncbi:MAG: Glycosyl transferase family 2 [Parcubacteria group bacterium GW2011_GWA1_47_8]|nr:MAG: Glycosyl transferase family 2 [Parcubacteria group bacterium GW2011_GWA1_47_8]
MKFSIITPVYNGEKYIAETIESILSQEGDFEIEYIIMDGASTDKTIEIIKSYEERLNTGWYKIRCKKITLKWYSQKDSGMYAAINKGFSLATGDTYAWLNSDDTYAPNALDHVAKTFTTFPDIKWLTGTNILIDESSRVLKTNPCYLYNQEWIRLGIYGRNAYFIHQESVFWRSELWNTSGGIDEKFKLVGDYYLWTEFSKHTPLWSLNTPLGCFRKRKNQLSEDTDGYRKEQLVAISTPQNFLTLRIRIFFWLKSKLPTFFEQPLHLLYRILFPARNRYYINIEKNVGPTKKVARSFVA